MFAKQRIRAIRSQYGKVPEERYEEEEIRAIRSYYDYRREKEQPSFSLDETTWYDLSMDRLFERICNTGSASGEQLLYYQLRCPAVDSEEYQRRYAFLRLAEDEPELRLKLQVILTVCSRALT